jgi:hypothetical protein
VDRSSFPEHSLEMALLRRDARVVEDPVFGHPDDLTLAIDPEGRGIVAAERRQRGHGAIAPDTGPADERSAEAAEVLRERIFRSYLREYRQLAAASAPACLAVQLVVPQCADVRCRTIHPEERVLVPAGNSRGARYPARVTDVEGAAERSVEAGCVEIGLQISDLVTERLCCRVPGQWSRRHAWRRRW